MVPTSFW